MSRIHISPDVALRYVTCRTCGNVIAVRPITEQGRELIRCGACKHRDVYHFQPIGFSTETDEGKEGA